MVSERLIQLCIDENAQVYEFNSRDFLYVLGGLRVVWVELSKKEDETGLCCVCATSV